MSQWILLASRAQTARWWVSCYRLRAGRFGRLILVRPVVATEFSERQRRTKTHGLILVADAMTTVWIRARDWPVPVCFHTVAHSATNFPTKRRSVREGLTKHNSAPPKMDCPGTTVAASYARRWFRE